MSQPFHLDMDVRWGDLDALNHVNNTNFLRYLEEARLAWLLGRPGEWNNDQRGPVLVHIDCNFRQAILYPARVRVTLDPERASDKRMILHHQILDAEDPSVVYADARLTVVWVDKQAGRAIPLPDDLFGDVEIGAA